MSCESARNFKRKVKKRPNSSALTTKQKEGDQVEILNANNQEIGSGEITSQITVHRYEVAGGWIPLLVKEIVPITKTWSEYPSHSGTVEIKSFVAWPSVHLRVKE
ncbi:Hypothetical predicted protein [Paramuricea clavata]|uniref:Uncharacterized protein n=1 Tax=Paramuricea clavata TaxID=317549 RepID=A0A6S7H227_PARCT|nr:Hypothetical predicted protein [Paramuricea clavata]